MGQLSARTHRLRDMLGRWWPAAWRWVLLASGAALSTYLILDRGMRNGVISAVLIGLLVIGVALMPRLPLAIALLATPGLIVVQRVGLGGTDLTVSDVALAAAFGSAALFGTYPLSRPTKQILALNLVYQFATLLTVIVNPFAQNTVEWFHAWLLVSGALLVGWALGRAGLAHAAFGLLIGAMLVVAVGILVSAVFTFAQGQFVAISPRWPLPMHKNAAGDLLAVGAVIALVNPRWAGWRDGYARLAFWTLTIAVVLTQSRQAIIGLVVAVLVVTLRRGASRRARMILLLVIPAIWFVISMVMDQIETGNRFNSYYVRIEWMQQVYALWKHSPIFGHGLRYWYVHEWALFQPPQAELEVVASAGVVGLLGFLIMWVGIIVVLWRVDPRFGTLAVAAVLSRIVQAQFDLFWVAAQVSVPFVVAGICLGAQALFAANRSDGERVDDLAWSIGSGGRYGVPARTGNTLGEGADGTA
ncbi:MAG: O-antigen ligase family protein [Microbacterium sp.]|uniref:O-antigen ligase family protein n=1 Tax=Microbacterium sp. TaxID=51671 RepID=UPI003F81C508